MKLILTGCTGLIGGNVLSACLSHPAITSIIALSRRPLGATTASHPKLQIVIMENFQTYPASVKEVFADADACIWAMGTSDCNRVVRVEHPLTFASALATTRSHPGTKFRFVYLSGAVSEVDQTAPLWYMQEARRVGGLGQQALLDFADRKENKGWCEGYAVRPGYVYLKNGGGWVGWLLGANLSIREDVLAAAMVDIAVNGAEERVLANQAIIAKGEEILGHRD